jgi:hypothetical protein
VTAPALTVPADILRTAADLITEHGVTSGDYADDDGRLDPSGAINQAMFGNPYPAWDEPQLEAELTQAVEVLAALVEHLGLGVEAAPGETDVETRYVYLAELLVTWVEDGAYGWYRLEMERPASEVAAAMRAAAEAA